MNASKTDTRIDKEIDGIKTSASEILELAYQMCDEMPQSDRKDKYDAIDDLIDNIKEYASDIDDNFDTLKDENDELLDELEDVEELVNPVTIDTMIGKLSYTTSNLMDCQLMEEFSKSIANIQPIKLLELLQGINNVSIKPNSTWVK